MDLVAALLDPGAYPETTGSVTLIQTHISWVFLTDRYAYKMKKPVNLGFLNFSTLRLRHHYLKQELVLNRRLCPEIYLAVLPVTQTKTGVRVGGRGRPLEYLLQMVRLPQERMMDEVAHRGELTLEVMERLVAVLTSFYRNAATGPYISHYGEPGVIAYNHEENFAVMKKLVGEFLSVAEFDTIRDFTRDFLLTQRKLLRKRLKEGRIRDCHGDLHMRNICLANGIYIFDCIEFNPRFRYGDVAADVAFLAMDLDFHGLSDFSRHLVEQFARASGDPDLFILIDFYKCYRACVRGKINALSAKAPEVPWMERERSRKLARAYFSLAYDYARQGARWSA
jgi:aminoglycoside phosphotransferase family enzyme|uniref:Aminoglycoside phosphotransferase domain-containing protein n=1 Tax=Desulfobacca acetoxidans TaxID=60893 RepID=A0A7C5AN12_9BACT